MKRTLFAATLALLLWGAPALAGPQSDFDSDGVWDNSDNCSETANSDQDDTDADDCGNLCDTDYDQNGQTGFSDFGPFSVNFGNTGHPMQQHSEPVDPARVVGFGDFGLFSVSFGSVAPGPSGTTSGTAACP